ncbi:MAG: NUDIX hydrolase [Ruminococcus sp.]|jgi:isopentenyldiphosphate isomerase
MELLDIVDEQGNPTGVVKERSLVHREGLLHRTSHVWIARKNEKSGMDLLLQKRSREKDSHPGCYDISSAGHIPAGCGYLTSALRELEEELGITARPEELLDRGIRHICWDEEFHDRMFRDRQVSRVYLLWKEIDTAKLHLQKEEVESVMWMDYKECMDAVEKGSIPNCISLEELKMLR